MSLKEFFLIFPSLFMFHELEELIFMPKFVSSNFSSFLKNKVGFNYSPFVFNLVVFEQFILLFVILVVSYYNNYFTFYITIIIAYVYHVVGHIIQSIILRKYIPGLISGIISSAVCILFIEKYSRENIQVCLYSLITLLLIFLNIAVSFKFLTKKQK